MKKALATAVFLAICLGAALLNISAQTCQEEEGAVTAVKQDLTDLAGTVQKEDLTDFQRHYHQRSFASRLSICLQTVGDMLGCLDKANHDPAATKAQLAAVKAKEVTYQKLQTALQHESQSLKSAKNAKNAKADIGNFSFAT